MICSHCGTENRYGDRFCEQCGAALGAENGASGGANSHDAASVLVRVDGSQDTPYKLGSRAVIGRLDTCDLAVNDKSISREHARLSRLRDGYVVEDLGSTNGTLVNGRRIDEAVILRAGDILTIGSVEFRFDQEAPASQSAENGWSRVAEAGAHEAQGPTDAAVAVEEQFPNEFPDAAAEVDDHDQNLGAPPSTTNGHHPSNVADWGVEVPPEPVREDAEPVRPAAIEDVLDLADRLHEAVESLASRLGAQEDLRDELDAVRQRAGEAERFNDRIREALHDLPATESSALELDSLRTLLDSLIENPKDIEVLMRIANSATAMREAVNVVERQTQALDRIRGLAEG